ncbi:MAG: FtsX-like permease family protein, partial [Deltaproteobacteria bacterium]
GGLGLGFGALSALKALLPADTPRLAAVSMDWRVLAFVSAVSILSGLVFGLAPALRISNSDLAVAMKAGGQRTTDAAGIHLRSSLIVSEIALAVVLISSAGLLIRTLWQLVQVNPGFRGEQILTVRVTPDESDCATRAACVALYDKLLMKARGLNGIYEAAAANTVPLSGEFPYVVAEVEGHPLEAGKNLAPLLWAGAVTPNYFQIMGIRLLIGRGFNDADGEHSAQVIVVSAATARHYWPGENPIGKHIRLVWDDDWRTVVGVAGDVRQFNLADKPLEWVQGSIYMPYAQSVDASHRLPRAMYILAHTSAGPGDFARNIHDLVASVNPNVPVGEVRSVRGIVAASTESSRSLMWLFVSFAGAALMLAVIGIYGVVSYSAAQRTYEMGIRVALGATPRNILGLVLGQGLRLVVAGLALGTLAALALTRLLANFLYGVSPADPPTFFLVAALLIAVTLLASYVPARRAASVDPLRALRVE